MSLSTISRCFLITLILYLWLYRFICQVYAHPRPKVGLQVFAFIFYLPPTIDTPLIITRARHQLSVKAILLKTNRTLSIPLKVFTCMYFLYYGA